MDSLKNFAEGVKNKPSNSNPQQANTAGAAGGQEDYLDKGLDSVEKKFGQGKVDPNKERGVNEKITDGARTEFEKLTGKNIPNKFSN